MTNVRIVRERDDIVNGWVVRADTKRFGKDAVMCEGSHDDCMKWWKGLFRDSRVEKITAYICGFVAEYGVWVDDVITLHRNGFEEHLSGRY